MDSQEEIQAEQIETSKKTTEIRVAVGGQEITLNLPGQEGFEEFKDSVKKLVALFVDFLVVSAFQISREKTEGTLVKLTGEIEELRGVWRAEAENAHKDLVTRAELNALKQELLSKNAVASVELLESKKSTQEALAKVSSEVTAKIEEFRKAMPVKETVMRVELEELKQAMEAELTKSHKELASSIDKLRKGLPASVSRVELEELKQRMHAELTKSCSELAIMIENIKKALPLEDIVTQREFDEFRKAVRAVM